VPPETVISDLSRWGDDRWYFENPTPGGYRASASVLWAFSLTAPRRVGNWRKEQQGEKFTDPTHAELLDSMRRLFWSLLTDNRVGKNMKPLTVAILGPGMVALVRWMVRNELTKISDLTPDACTVFMADLAADATRILDEDEQDQSGEDEEPEDTSASSDPDDEDPGKPMRRADGTSYNFAYNALSVVTYLFQQRDMFREAGIEPPAVPPLGNRSTSAAAAEIMERASVMVRPIPKEIAVKVMSTAVRFLQEPAEDIIRLQDLYLAARGWVSENGLPVSKQDSPEAVKVLRAFRFSQCVGEATPWRAPLIGKEERHGGRRAGRDLLRATPSQILPQLIDDVIGAAGIVIQGMSGVRISEVLGIEVDPDHPGPWPSYIDVRISATGVNEIFYLKSKVFKSTDSNRETEWLIGSRTLGSQVVPPIVHALRVIERLLAPWRQHSRCRQLFLTVKASRGLFSTPEAVRGLTGGMLLKAQRVFTAMYVKFDWKALPDTPLHQRLRLHGAWGLKSHQWRSTFAQFLYATDATSLSLLSDHFKHMNSAFTEQRYVGGNPSFLDYFKQARYSMTINTLREVASGHRPAVGGFAKLVQEHAASLISRDAATDPSVTSERLERLILDHDLRLWFFGHGKCGGAFRPLDALCHQETEPPAASRIGRDWEPNWARRRLSVCMRCSNWMVDPEHESSWQQTLSEATEKRAAHLGVSPPGVIEQLDHKIRQAQGILQVLESRGAVQRSADET